MENLWSPWRMAYIRAEPATADDGQDCVFCRISGDDDDAANYVLYRGTHSYIVLNAFPYNPGHLMVTPYRHTGDLEALAPAEAAELMSLATDAMRALRQTAAPHGFNLGMNLGNVAGAGIAAHVHLHVVPRWGGDTNFLPIIGQTKVLPELLAETYERLRLQFD